ncbi:Fe(3+) ABC transporter substrate-binding protein [Suttonella sp. R2A3]|uniref:Fe(3+) ABC transporter substrate-binding protein n=1 Tax=Suttonella sp. R2A3 TaxID=2908648 RepID=UPI001F290AA8|nr:Fe(3+) ABC transporter substrate-binding protein [Suttonella sp. R2A3]UJF23834.1 Fe(3+) ABC transporter substrate-binding protein [Suttonella sp. R2A3]
MRQKIIVGALLGAISASALADVNVYSYRQDFLIQPMLDAFTEETGIKTNTIYVKDGLAERIKREGAQSPADIVLTVDISRLEELVNEGLTQAIESETVNANIPENMRGDQWVALTSRARNVYSSKERVGELPTSFTYLDLAKPEYKGKICTRSGKHPYNLSLIASVIAHEGEAAAKTWLEGVKANLARKPQGNDRGQVKAIMEGICDYALGNSYYYGKMLTNEKEPEQKAWAESAVINFPNQETYGTHMNVSGVALAKYAPNKDEALQLIEFLTADKAQQMYADVNFEYPVKEGVAQSDLVASWGEFKQDEIDINEVADNYSKALKLVDEVQFDL